MLGSPSHVPELVDDSLIDRATTHSQPSPSKARASCCSPHHLRTYLAPTLPVIRHVRVLPHLGYVNAKRFPLEPSTAAADSSDSSLHPLLCACLSPLSHHVNSPSNFRHWMFVSVACLAQSLTCCSVLAHCHPVCDPIMTRYSANQPQLPQPTCRPRPRRSTPRTSRHPPPSTSRDISLSPRMIGRWTLPWHYPICSSRLADLQPSWAPLASPQLDSI